jgi:hypothetical protein
LVDVMCFVVGAARSTVAALVVEHQPCPIPKGLTLKMPRVLIECVSVREDDGEICTLGVIGFIYLYVKDRAVVGEHFSLFTAQHPESLGLTSCIGQCRTSNQSSLGKHPDRCSGSKNTRCGHTPTSNANRRREIHCLYCSVAEVLVVNRRGTRAPNLVTIS